MKTEGLAVLLLLFVFARRRGAKAPRATFTWSEHDMREFVRELEPLGIPLADSLLVYTAESGLDPTASSGIAFGVCQLTQIAAKQIGWTRPLREFGTLTVAQQAPWIARLQAAQIRQIGYTPSNALELYVANLSPKAARERADVIYREGSDSYRKNAGLDRNHKGYIAPADLAMQLNAARSSAVYKRALELLERVRGVLSQ